MAENEFDLEDVITTSGLSPIDPTTPESSLREIENACRSFNSFDQAPVSWF